MGPQILEGLLHLEEADDKRKLLVLAFFLLCYYFLHIFVIDGAAEANVIAITNNDALAVFTLYSLVWVKPLHLVLGRDRYHHLLSKTTTN